jgi:DNA-binding IclR family transcriptional regulator
MPGSTEHLLRQLAVLRACAGGAQRFTVLRTRLGVPASTLARQLRGLVAVDLLRIQDEGYALAPGATGLALELLGQQRAAGVAEDVVAELARQTGASAAYWILDAGRLILVAKHEVDGGFHYMDRFAHRTPASSVFGLAIIAGHHAGLRRAGASARRIARSFIDEGAYAGILASEPDTWRVVVPVTPGGSIGISRHGIPTTRMIERDRRCVAAAALGLAQRLSA